jgi:hypothetical protein
MKTIAQQLNVKEFPFIIKDSNGKGIYREESNGSWVRYEYDSNGKEILLENSAGDWIKHEYDSDGKEIYYESSFGTVIDHRPETEIQKAIDLLTKEGLIVDGKILKN